MVPLGTYGIEGKSLLIRARLKFGHTCRLDAISACSGLPLPPIVAINVAKIRQVYQLGISFRRESGKRERVARIMPDNQKREIHLLFPEMSK